MARRSGNTTATVNCGGCIALVMFNLLLGGIATQYVVQFWGGFCTHHIVTIPLLVCAIAGLFVGELTVPMAVLTWLFSFVMHAPGY